MSEIPAASTVRLDTLAAINPEALSSATSANFTFSYVDINSIESFRLSFDEHLIEFRDAPSRARRIVRSRDVLMSTVRPNLRAFAYCGELVGDVIASTGFAVIRAKQQNDPRFLLYSILSDEVGREIESYCVGSNYPAINAADVKRLSIRNFKPGAQRAISIVLSSLDTQIEATEALIAKQERLRAGLMQDLFTRGVDENGELRPPREDAPHLYHETELGWLPKGWEDGSILRYCTKERQPILTGPFGADLGSEDFVEDGVPLLRIGNVQDRYLKLYELLYVSERKALQLSKYRIVPSDLLFARQGATTGRNALASEEVDGALINYHIIRVSLDTKKCEPRFVESMFNSWLISHQIEQSKGRGTREGINTQQIVSLKFPGPNLEEQRRLTRLLNCLIEKIAELKVELEKLRLQKVGLMQDLLTGTVSVEQLLEKEPA